MEQPTSDHASIRPDASTKGSPPSNMPLTSPFRPSSTESHGSSRSWTAVNKPFGVPSVQEAAREKKERRRFCLAQGLSEEEWDAAETLLQIHNVAVRFSLPQAPTDTAQVPAYVPDLTSFSARKEEKGKGKEIVKKSDSENEKPKPKPKGNGKRIRLPDTPPPPAQRQRWGEPICCHSAGESSKAGPSNPATFSSASLAAPSKLRTHSHASSTTLEGSPTPSHASSSTLADLSAPQAPKVLGAASASVPGPASAIVPTKQQQPTPATLAQLAEFGLHPGVFNAVKGRPNETPPPHLNPKDPSWAWLLYNILRNVPSGMLRLRELHDLVLAWCPARRTADPRIANNTCRSILSRGDKCFAHVVPSEAKTKTVPGWWRIAMEGKTKVDS